MTTDDLILRLVGDLRPVSRWAVPRRLFFGLAGGAVVSSTFVLDGLRVRPDLAEAVQTAGFWAKLAYMLAMCGLGAWIASRALRPAGETLWRTVAILGPLCAVCLTAGAQMTFSEPGDFAHLFWGSTALTCPLLLMLCSVGPLAGLIWATQSCAPTDAAKAGAAIGLAAGGMGGALYSLHCTEQGMLFLAVWYTLGLTAVVLVGCAIGSRYFHW